ncbi:cytochrome P450 [Crossiella sp. CA-258035]|uniref:cytochrome P450 n=1 Tax=Crossiella sp. CA-258035 TaxID=2981138 RepID=UPI0024BD4CBC|nr:cytochrome P450 [Crossiella sp. CA-258035]WHT22170.1 cytochrome P450 [Crossiella sp. CA-258035]
MRLLQAPLTDNSAALLVEGYAWLPDRLREADGAVVRTRLMGQPTLCLTGPEAARFFYDEHNIRRQTAIPGPVQSTLFGHGAVHTLDGAEHRCRKDLFLSVVGPGTAADLVEHTSTAWKQETESWRSGQRIVLFEAAARVLTQGVCRWAGIPLGEAETPAVARDLTAMVDGFATPGPRHWRARRARARQEERLGQLVTQVRAGAAPALPGSALLAVASHRDADGQPLDSRLAAVELLNIIRPTVAVSWFVTFAGHALHRWPQHREPLRAGEPGYATAFAQELRRFYPFAPFLGGRAARDLTWRGERIPAGALVLLDLYGQNHDPRLWPDPYRFDPARFLDRTIGEFELVPQGAGDPRTGHRCPGEAFTLGLLEALTTRLAQADYRVPPQDLRISLRRVPALPASRFVLIPD